MKNIILVKARRPAWKLPLKKLCLGQIIVNNRHSYCKNCFSEYSKSKGYGTNRDKLDFQMLENLRLVDKEYQARKRAENSEWKKEENKEYARKNPEKIRAHQIVWKAIKKGLLTKNLCKVCGNNKVHAHHPNYTEPLRVEWLCSSHHKKEHLELVNN